MGLGLVTVLRTDNVLVTSCFTVTLIIRPWSTKIEHIGKKVEFRHQRGHRRREHGHGPLRYGLKIEQIYILEVPHGKLRNIPKKSSKLSGGLAPWKQTP